VAGIRKQRERAGDDAPDDLGDHEAAREQRRDAYAALVGAVGVMVLVVMIVMTVTVIVVVGVRVGVLHGSIRLSGMVARAI
jgi:hypothetical protein